MEMGTHKSLAQIGDRMVQYNCTFAHGIMQLKCGSLNVDDHLDHLMYVMWFTYIHTYTVL